MCQAPFLFENNLEDHKKVHMPREPEPAPAIISSSSSNSISAGKKQRKSTKEARRKQQKRT
ncbi:hypothetical protein Ngar_c31110 [Candidatus Nitrososphaera gargensis Ga9.2]|uniref:C2H2-type domain-containing protein n=1 Tax=Nitrososphaera gargensis (strain Ga9.2) TaxID=1237085 RepID=K0IM60_NITGG|nr:hypothetical protein Ngar_c31110 [Candidatus Nitrososphaera gargensis Ga9.2]